MMHLCVRTSVDWADEAAYRRHLWPDMLPKVGVWDATFRLSWREFRVTTAALARENLAEVDGARITAWDDVPEGDLVLPVDDDDWFAPDILKRLASVDVGRPDGVVWTQSTLEVPINLGHRLFLFRRRLQPSLLPRWFCATNNYAVRKGPMDLEAWQNHMRADARFRGNPGIPFIARRLSLHNRTLASATSMGWRQPTVSARTLLAKRRAYLRLYTGYRPPTEDLAWALPYIARMRGLMERLEPR